MLTMTDILSSAQFVSKKWQIVSLSYQESWKFANYCDTLSTENVKYLISRVDSLNSIREVNFNRKINIF